MKDDPVGPVAALILDGAGAPETARRAAALARMEGRPLILLVPVERTGFSLSPLTHRLAAIRQTADAEAIAARVRPVLESTASDFQVRAVPCLFTQAVTTGGASLKSIKAAARRIRAFILVTPIRQNGGTITTKAQRLRPDRHAGAIGDASEEQP